jgi:hypothetical protein
MWDVRKSFQKKRKPSGPRQSASHPGPRKTLPILQADATGKKQILLPHQKVQENKRRQVAEHEHQNLNSYENQSLTLWTYGMNEFMEFNPIKCFVGCVFFSGSLIIW